MTPHNDALHALRSAAGLTMSEAPLSERLRLASEQLAGRLEAGNMRRLPQCERTELRNLALFLSTVSTAALELENPPAPKRRRWWPW